MRITITAIATPISVRPFFLTSLDSSSTNGSTKWPKMSARPTHCHPPPMRFRYQGISSGRFADQMIRNCENEK